MNATYRNSLINIQKGWKWKNEKMYVHLESKYKNVGMTTLISDKVNFKTQNTTRDLKRDVT